MKRKKIKASKKIKLLAGEGAGVIRESVQDISKLRDLLRMGGTFFISFLLSTVRGPMGTYPYSYAVLCSSSGGLGTALSFMGSILGTVAMDSGALWQILILLSILFIRLWVCIFKGDFKEKNALFRRLFRERGYIKAVVASLGAAAAGVVAIVESESIYYGLFSALLGIGEALIVTLSFVFLSDRGAEKSKRTAGLFVLILGVGASLAILRLPFSIEAVFAFLVAVYFGYGGGAALGCIAGLAGGLAVGASYAPAFAAVGIVTSLFWEYSRVASVIVSGIAASVLSLFSGGLSALSDVIPEIALGTAIASPFVSLGPFPASLPSFVDFDRGKEMLLKEVRTEKRLPKLREAFDSLSTIIREVGDRLRLPTSRDAQKICAAAREKYCKGCVHEKECTGREASTVDSMFYNMAYRLSQHGRVTARIVPESVARRCFNIDPMIESINSGAKRVQSLTEGAIKSEMFASDYSAIANLLREMGEDEGIKRDEKAEGRLYDELSLEGFAFSDSSVWGTRRRRVYLRGIDFSTARAGEEDIRLCAERVLSARLSSPEFSIEGNQVSAALHSLPVIGISSGKFSLQSKRDSQSGDSLCFFENDEGYFYALVSDGMGSGREAAVTSGISAVFLEKLLSAGCPMRSALEMLNCFVRASSGECFTTVDLMEADLYTGRARFIKSGAAPTFVIRKGQIYRIHSKTVPVGIMRALDAEAVAFDLKAGDTVIMMTDGVTGSYEESPWLYDLLSEGIKGIESPSILARTIATAAAENTGREDDITVCVIKVEEGGD